jgi:hypothetical protein
MIIIQLTGGLGNQMFQYAAGRYLSMKYKTPLTLDLSFLLDRSPRKNFVFRDYNLDIFQIDPNITSQNNFINFGIKAHKIQRLFHIVRQKINNKHPVYVRESENGFDVKFFSIPSHAYLEGYWQSEEYFKEIVPTIRKDFTFRSVLDKNAAELAKTILSVNSVCVFVRRKEYVSIPRINLHHGVCEEAYFNASVQRMSETINGMNLFIFSDDIEWCRSTLRYDFPCTIVDHSFAGDQYGQYLHLMSLCRHFIIANSSYGWWGAWLNNDPNKIVIAPKQWYKNPKMDTSHLLPQNWIRL